MKNIRWTNALLSMLLVISASGCTGENEPQSSSASIYTPGTYSGSGSGMNGRVSVTLTVDESTIVDIQLDVSGETESIGGAAAEQLRTQILQSNGTSIDGVSGATLTSDGIREAVDAALNKAQGNVIETEMTPGKYSASAHGSKHDLTVEVTVDANSITDIRVVESNDSPYISDAAIDQLPQRIVDAQSLNVDVVSGATLTSAGILNAVADCIVQAGGDLDAWNKKVTSRDKEDVYTDVLVVGGGTSGMTAALAAKTNSSFEDVDSTLDIMIVESNGYMGGNMAICGGYIASYFGTALNEYTGNSWDPDELVDSLVATFPQYNDVIDETLMRRLVEYSPTVLNGLMARGFYLHEQDGYIQASSRLCPNGACDYTSSSVVADTESGERSGDNGYDIYGGGAYFASTLSDILNDAGVQVRYETTATSLIMDGDMAVGVHVNDLDGEYDIYADRIILATGYAGLDDETVEMYLPETFVNIVNAQTEADQSFAQKQISALGGSVNNVHDPISDGHIVLGYNTVLAHFGEEALLYNSMPSMFVSSDGTRFMDESVRGNAMAMTLLDHDGKSYMIFDSSHEGVCFYEFLHENGLAWRGETILELAENAGIDAQKLQETINTYNSDYQSGADSQFDTPLEWMAPVVEAPFYAVQVNAISTGGVDIGVFTDENLNVLLDNNGQPLQHLYACGGAGSAGYFTLSNIGLGAHILNCLTSGAYAGNVVREDLLNR